MSFGGSSQNQVRYALIVDDQATAKLNTFKNSLTQLGVSTTKFARENTVLNNSFSAGVLPIKNAGNAMNQLANTHKTLGAQLGGIASGFKNNALAIGAAASSVLGLYQNYANLSSAQNAANKAATAAKAAQNSVTTATKNLNKAIAENGKNSKAAQDAQAKLTVAQERAVNKTESAKIAQDNLNQTMADFGINVLPNVLLAGGSIVSIFDGMGSKGKLLSGIVSKLGGVFGGIIPSLTGIGTKAPIAATGMTALGGASTVAGTGLKGFAVSALAATGGIAGMVALAGPVAGLIKTLLVAGELLPKTGDLLMGNIETRIETAKTWFEKLKEIPLTGGLQDILDKLTGISPALDKAGKSAGTATPPVERLASGIKIYADNTNTATGISNTFSKSTLVLTSDIIDFEKAVSLSEAAVAKNDSTIAAFGDTIDNLAKKFLALNKAQKNIGTFPSIAETTTQSIPGPFGGNPTAITKTTDADVIKRRVEAFQAEEDALIDLGKEYGVASAELEKFRNNGKDDVTQLNFLIGSTIDYTAALTDANLAQKLIAQGFMAGRKEANAFFMDLVRSTDQETSFTVSLAEGASELGIHSSLLAFSSTKMKELITTTYEQTAAFDELQMATASSTKFLNDNVLILAQVRAGMLEGTQAANDFFISSVKNVAQEKAEHDQLVKIAKDWGLDLPASIKLTTAQLQNVIKAEMDTKTGTLELEKAITEKLKPSFEHFGDIFSATNWKDFKSAWKDLGKSGGLKGIPKDLRDSLKDIGKDLIGINKHAQEATNVIDALLVSAFSDRQKGTKSGLKALLEDVKDIPGNDKLGPFKDAVKELIDLPKEERTQALKNYTDAFAAYKDAVKADSPGGTIITSGEAENINNLTLAAKNGAQPVTDYAESIGTLSDKAKLLSTIKMPSWITDPNAFGAIAKATNPNSRFATVGQTTTPTQQKMPVVDQRDYQKGLQLAINNAAQTVKLIASEIAKVSSIQMPTPNESTYQKGLQLAIDNSNQTVQIITKTLKKISSIQVPPPNESKYQKGLQLAIDNAAQTVKLIKKALDAIGKIKVPAPKFNSFNSALDQAVSDTKRAVRDINNALKKINKPSSGGGDGHGPGATTGPFAQGGTVIANQRTTATFGEAGPELAMFVPLKGGGMRSVGSGSAGGGNVEVVNIINIMDEHIMRKITARSGKNRFQYGF